MGDSEEIVMTPLHSEVGQAILFERLPSSALTSRTLHHVAGGPYQGIVIAKSTGRKPDSRPPHVIKSFTAHMVDPKHDHAVHKEKRLLRFWFHEDSPKAGQFANYFLEDLLGSELFPKDPIAFIVRVLNLLKQYNAIHQMELEMRPLTMEDEIMMSDSGPRQILILDNSGRLSKVQEDLINEMDAQQLNREVYAGTNQAGFSSIATSESRIKKGPTQEDMIHTEHMANGGALGELGSVTVQSAAAPPRPKRKLPPLTKQGRMIAAIAKKQKILNMLEDAYPSPLQMENLIKLADFQREDVPLVEKFLQDLMQRGLIQELDEGRWLRRQAKLRKADRKSASSRLSQLEAQEKAKHDIKIIKNLPRLPPEEQPSIAVITLLYCEKLAVDAMMDYKVTFVRYKSEGEAQVYTVGKIGKHRVVSTKLSRIGYGEGDNVAAGSVITRLLGTFGQIEHVFLVGCGGGTPNYTSDSEHVRLGDIVLSKPITEDGAAYLYCTGFRDTTGGHSFTTKSWRPIDNVLQNYIQQMDEKDSKNDEPDWVLHLQKAMEDLAAEETRFYRPAPETDRLIQHQDDKIVEVPHPTSTIDSPRSVHPTRPVVHVGVIGTGKVLHQDGELRQEFAKIHGIKLLDSGFQAVMESIEGNRKDSFLIIKGVSDYINGQYKKEWQPYASLAAAAYLKALVLCLPADDGEDED